MRKRLKNRVFIILMTLMITGALILSGCSGTSGEPGADAGRNVAQDTSSATGKGVSSSDGADTQQESGTAAGTHETESRSEDPAGTSSVTGTESDGTSKDTQTAPKDTGSKEETKTSENTNTSDTASEAPDDGEDGTEPSDKSEDTGKSGTNGTGIILAADDDSLWANSFLLFLPRYKGGVEEDRICEETFDHIVIGGIESKRNIEDYIEEIKAAGFDVDADYVDHNGEIDFHAYNHDGWYVTVDYDIKTAKADIGCGFFAQEKEKEPGSFFSEEILEVLPLPEAGTLSSGKSDGGYPYVLYEGCTLEDARSYAGKLKKAGFDSEVMEGESGDLCWYNALGPNGMICDMQYSDGIIMIGCDTAEK